MYIVSSGDGYFVRFEEGSPLMDTDPMTASRLRRKRADEVIRRLEKMGFVGELVELVFARIPEVEGWWEWPRLKAAGAPVI